MPKTIMLGKRNQVTLPAEFIDSGVTQFECERRNGSIVLTPCLTIPASQAYFWTKRWQEGERQASEDLKHGRYKDFDNVEDLILELREARKKYRKSRQKRKK